MQIKLKNVDKIIKADMQLVGLTIFLTSNNVPSDIIGNVIFCSDILLSHYVDKLYEHRAFEVVEICTENDSFNSLSNTNKLYLFNKFDRELRKKVRLYNTIEEEIREILNIFDTILNQKSSIAKQIKRSYGEQEKFKASTYDPHNNLHYKQHLNSKIR